MDSQVSGSGNWLGDASLVRNGVQGARSTKRSSLGRCLAPERLRAGSQPGSLQFVGTELAWGRGGGAVRIRKSRGLQRELGEPQHLSSRWGKQPGDRRLSLQAAGELGEWGATDLQGGCSW